MFEIYSQFSKIVTNSPFGFCMSEIVRDDQGAIADFCIVDVNPAFETIVDFKRVELAGKTASQVFTDSYPVLHKAVMQIIGQRIPPDFDLYVPGSECWYTVRNLIIDDTVMVTLFVDVTAYKGKAEELELFFQVNLDMFSIADFKGNFIKLNKQWQQVLGYEIRELENINYHELIHPDDLDSTRRVLAELEKQKEVSSFVNRYRAKNGEYRFIEWQCKPNGAVIFSSSRDITEQLQVAQQLAYNEQLYRGLLESQGDIIARIDKHFCFSFVNDVYCKTFGVNKDELTGAHMFVQVDESNRSRAVELFEQLKQPPHRFQLVQHMPTAIGYRWISWAISALFDAQHEFIELMAVGRDITDIKLQEEKLESQEKFRQIVDNIGGVFWLLSADKKEVLFVSSNFERLYGRPYLVTGDPLKPLKDSVYTDDREKFDRAIGVFMKTGQFNEEFRVVYPGNEVRWVTSSAFPVLDDRAQVQSYAGMFQDITERKNIELSEAEKTNRLNAILQAIPDLMFIISADGVYLDIFSSDSSKLAAPPDQIIGTSIRDYFPGQADYLLSLFRQSIREKKVITGRYTLTIDGELLHYEARITPLGDDKILSVVRDVTELVYTTRQLQFQTRMQQLLVKISNTYINIPADGLDALINNSLQELGEFIGADRFYIFDYRKEVDAFYNTYEWCSPGVEPQIEYLQGTPAAELQFWMDMHLRGEVLIIHDVMAMDAADPIRRLLEPQNILSIITLPLFDEGEYIGFIGIDSVHSQKLFDDDELQLLKVFGQTLMSTRQRIRAHAELEEALVKAKESDRLKSAFLATISHELRTPLNHILGFSELINMISQEEDIRNYANEIHTSGKGLLERIEDVFSIALAEKSAMQLRLSTMKGVELYLSSKNYLHEMLHATGKGDAISLIFQPEACLMSQLFVSDRQKIQQVLAGLFSNAVKFTRRGSIEFGMTRVGASIEFFVKDTGIGIAPDQHACLFDLFRQVDDSYSRRFEGLGIGLTIVRKIADVLGASIRVESSPGDGSCFYFNVPVEFI